MGSGEAMLHIVLIDEDWDCSVTLRIFMADEAATKTGEFIEKAVQTSCVGLLMAFLLPLLLAFQRSVGRVAVCCDACLN